MLDWIKPEYIERFLAGLQLTLLVSLLAFALALLVGVVITSMRISGLGPLKTTAFLYVAFFRNVPALALLFLTVFGLPQLGVKMPLLWCAVLAIGLYEGAFAAEALRTGVNSVSVGTTEAARALGCANSQTLLKVVMPQALRSIVPSIGNLLIKTILATSLLAIIGIEDLTGVAQRINIREAQPILFLFSGATYVILCILSGQLTGYIERKVRIIR